MKHKVPRGFLQPIQGLNLSEQYLVAACGIHGLNPGSTKLMPLFSLETNQAGSLVLFDPKYKTGPTKGSSAGSFPSWLERQSCFGAACRLLGSVLTKQNGTEFATF